MVPQPALAARMYDGETVLKTVQTEVALEEDTFEFLNKHLEETKMDLGDFLSLLLLSKITEMARLGFLVGKSEDSAHRLLAELDKFDERNGALTVISNSQKFAAEDLVDLEADVHPAFYRAQFRVMGTA